jgi:diguanylate cyclase (GGDEF)-like protein
MNRSRARARRHPPEKRARTHSVARLHEAEAPKAKAAVKRRPLPMQLAAELDALKDELARARARVAELETRVDEDPLTGLLNRRGFERALSQALAYVRRYNATAALLFLDLDGFKAVNDRYGHAAGDWVLVRIAKMIVGHVRASDVVARIGGDEIVVLLWNLNAAQAEAKARGLEQLAAAPFERNGKRFKLGLSAGFTMLTSEDTAEIVLARADRAMYARKRTRQS